MLEDLIILGRAAPEELRDGRQTICVAGYTKDLGLIRLYPTRWDMELKRWNKVKVPVEKPIRPQFDYREESWKIEGSRSEWDRLSNKITPAGRLRKKADQIALTESLVSGCTSLLWPEGRSLGIIKPEIEEFYFEKNKNHKKVKQTSLDGSFRVHTKNDFEYIPRVKYRCSECEVKKFHDQQILEWGLYVGMMKNPKNIDVVWDYVGFSNMDEWELYFVVGNLYTKPKAFNVISVLRWKR